MYRSGKITTDKTRTAMNTEAIPHHHRTLSESVIFLDYIWHVLLTTASPYTLTSISLCQGKSGLVCEQYRFPLAKLPVDVAMGKEKASCAMLCVKRGILTGRMGRKD
jgi:hypothetical protein